MHEVRFRAWRRKYRQMDYSRSWKSLGEFFEWHERNYPGEFDLTQFIGLKDRNGKEIYEGDILDADGALWLVEPIGTEERDGGKFGLCASPYGSGEAYFIDKSILDGKVIGNIYEHPHLLKRDEDDK